MKFKRISMRNIRSYEEAAIEFPDGKVLLSGDIGSGKSSILLAIEFALFGLQRGTGGSSLLRNGTNNGKVRLNFEIDGKEITVERALKKSRDSIAQDSCFIEEGGRREEVSNTELKSRILKLLNYPSEFMTKNPVLYRYTVYTPQEEMKAILLEEADMRLNTLRRVFGIDKYKRIIENAEFFSSRLREKTREKESRVLDLGDKRHELERKKEEREKTKTEIATAKLQFMEIGKIIEERRKAVSEIEEKSKELSRLKIEISGITSELRMKKEQKEHFSGEIREISRRIGEIETGLREKNFDQARMEKIILDIAKKEMEMKGAEKCFLEINKRIFAHETDKRRIRKITDDIASLQNCPTCRQNVAPEHKRHIQSKTEEELKAIDNEMRKLADERSEAERNRNHISLELQRLRQEDKEISSLKVESRNLEERKAGKRRFEENAKLIESRITELEVKRASLEGEISSFGDIEKRYSIARNMLEEARSEEKRIEILKARAEKQAEEAGYVIERLEKEIIQKEKTRQDIIHIKKLESWLSVNFVKTMEMIEKEVMAKVHSEFSSLFGKWFEMLVEGLSARINEEFTPLIEQNGYEIDYKYLSGGERTAAALAYRLSLNQVINSLMSEIKTRGILILDEPTDGFSQEQLDKLRNVFDELKIAQLILVSHEQKIEGFVEKVIRLRKEDITVIA